MTGYFNKKHTKLLRQAFNKLLVDLRPHVIPILEFSPAHDDFLSTIGNKYGDIYETAFETAKNSNLNKKPVPDYYETHMKPIMRKYPAPKAKL